MTTNKPVRIVPRPNELRFVDLFRIKAATGVDPLDPPSYAHAIAACLWFSLLGTPDELSFEAACEYDLDHCEFADETDTTIEEEQIEDPTHGSETPSNVSP